MINFDEIAVTNVINVRTHIMINVFMYNNYDTINVLAKCIVTHKK